MKDRLLKILSENKIQGIVISDMCNMRYISGYTGDCGYVVWTAKAGYVLVDSRYTVRAKEEAKGFKVIEISPQYKYTDALQDIIKENGIFRIGFENLHITYREYDAFIKKVSVKEWVPLGEALNDLRIIKSDIELDCIKKAEEIGDKAFAAILDFIKPGVTELEVAAELEYRMKLFGGETISFETIVASGVNSSKPHAVPTRKVIEPGDFVTMDFGCKYNGYCSDMTRTLVVGKASDKQKDIYNIVLEASNKALDYIKAGRVCKDVDKVARDVIESYGYGECFGHSLGHGVGLYIHENPRLGQGDLTVLEPGMTETIEPGIYIDGFGGVRIEDLVAITRDGYINFTHSDKKLIEIS